MRSQDDLIPPKPAGGVASRQDDETGGTRKARQGTASHAGRRLADREDPDPASAGDRAANPGAIERVIDELLRVDARERRFMEPAEQAASEARGHAEVTIELE